LAIICIDKNLSAQLALADRHYLLAKGQVAWSGSSTELRAQADNLRSELSI
jgi:branched-chain amino acid transport system ATP-binding protein